MGAEVTMNVKELAVVYEGEVQICTSIDAVLQVVGDGDWNDVKFIAHVPGGVLYYHRLTQNYYIVDED